MTTTLFLLLLLVVVLGAVAAFVLSTRAVVGRIMERHGTMPPTMIGAVSILFGLFVGFSSAEITGRGGALRLAAQREVSAARSILNFTTGIGPHAYAVREAMVEYLQVVTTTERDWLANRRSEEAPGTGPAFSLNLITTGFVQQPGASDVLKAALLNRVDDLTNARTDRLTLGRGAGNIPQWVGLASLALVTQMIGAMAIGGQRGGSFLFVAGFTMTAMVGLIYLGVADGLIGPSRSQEQTAPFGPCWRRRPSCRRRMRTPPAECGTVARSLWARGRMCSRSPRRRPAAVSPGSRSTFVAASWTRFAWPPGLVLSRWRSSRSARPIAWR
jgi:hypothetical protein